VGAIPISNRRLEAAVRSHSRRPASTPAPDLSRPWRVWHERLEIETTTPMEFVDITEDLTALLWRCDLTCGVANVQTRHTTTGIVVNEHEPLLLDDFRRTLERAAPRLGGYAHDDLRRRWVNLVPDERANGHAHCQALFLPSSASINLVDGRLCLGRWQRVFFVELDGGQRREVSVVVMGETGGA
jgi:secondary thiamine-phosphate synthase enzyme